MSIKSKLLLFLFCLFIFMSLILYFQRDFEKRRLLLVSHSELEEKNSVFNRIVELNGKGLEILAYDYSFWDEMVDFLKGSDGRWAKDNLEASLATYGANKIWVYRSDLSLCYVTGNVPGPDVSIAAILRKKLPELFISSPFVHFYTTTPHGLMEIRGATIHPSADVRRKTRPLGYFFVGRLWSDTALKELSKLIDGRADIVKPEYFKQASFFNLKTGQMIFSKRFQNEMGHSVAQLNAVVNSKVFSDISRLSGRYVWTNLLFGVILCGFSFYLLGGWIHYPLRTIARSLKEEKPDYLERLKKQSGEFGDIARLIIRFFDQKKILSDEVTVRRDAETQLQTSQKRFRDIVENAMEWIWEIDAQGCFSYVSPAMIKALGYTIEDILGKHFYDFFHPEDFERQKKEMMDLFLLRQPFHHLEHRCCRKDGTPTWILTTAVPIYNDKHEFWGYRGVVTDITQLKDTENSLKTKLEELEKINRFMVDRELRMAELKIRLKAFESDSTKAV